MPINYMVIIIMVVHAFKVTINLVVTACGDAVRSSHLSCHKHCGKCYTSLYTEFDGVSSLLSRAGLRV